MGIILAGVAVGSLFNAAFQIMISNVTRMVLVPENLRLRSVPDNPSLPPRKASIPSRFRPPPGPITTTTNGIGPRRVYLDIQSQPPDVAYPPRPVPGSIADLDVVMEHCDFSEKKVRLDFLARKSLLSLFELYG